MLSRLTERFLDFVARLNSTNAVVLTGILITMTTAARYQMSGLHIGKIGFAEWVPSLEWLAFCTAVMGVATTHFAVKRSTDTGYTTAKKGVQPTTVTTEQATVQADNVVVQETPTPPNPPKKDEAVG